MAGVSICFDVRPLHDMVGNVGWYQELRKDVESSRSTIVVSDGEYRREIESSRRVLLWLAELARSGLVKNVPWKDVEICTKEIVAEPEAKCQECDDHHLFAICHLGRAEYLFTQDARLAKCRTKMKKNNKLKKFCGVKIVSAERVYKKHRQRII
jgi:predicted nucleic acid-binding protein